MPTVNRAIPLVVLFLASLMSRLSAADTTDTLRIPRPPLSPTSDDFPSTLPTCRCPHIALVPDDSFPMNPDLPPWRDAPALTPFILCDGKTVARQQTVARAVWDDRALYVLFVCQDSQVWATLMEHNTALFKEEVAEIFLDPERQGRRYFEFEINPHNARFAAVIENNGELPPRFRPSRRLDPRGLLTRVAIDGTLNDPATPDRQWTVFARIPFAYLDLPTPTPGDTWRANFYRIDRTDPLSEFSCWSPTLSPAPNFHISRRFGVLVFAP